MGISGKDLTKTGLTEKPTEPDKKHKTEIEPVDLAVLRLLTIIDTDGDQVGTHCSELS